MCVQTDRLLSITAYFACGSAAAWYVFSFSEKFGSPSQIFRKKKVMFHPAGGESGQLSRQTPGFGTDRVTPVM